ncbi:MAG: transposase, partial [Patescibacteria group bacterium]
YQHLNPLELIEPNWKEEGIKDWRKVNQFLESYRWSSYLDYIGIKNFPSVTNRQLINFYFKKPEEYKEFITEFLPKNLEKIQDLIIEK